jgi:DNA primase large subunit
MQSAGMSFEELEPKAKQEPRWGRLLRFNLSESDFQNSTFYKIPFAQASDLIKNREVVVQAGVAYVPGTKLVSIVTARYRANLSRSLAKAAASFAAIAEDARIGPLLKNMNQQYTGKNFNKNLSGVEGELTAANVDDHAKRSMPLCMRQAHMGLKKDHKLKHDARRQYGLFLKGAGMSMEDSIQFFQREFTKIISGDDFNKNYLYNIRHMYGKEGKRQDYTPFSSTTIIMGPRPVANDIGSHHGCPFAHSSDGALNALLGQLQIGADDRSAIMKHTKEKNFGLACQAHFNATHPEHASVKDDAGKRIPMDNVGNHPNAWFMASTKYVRGGGGAALLTSELPLAPSPALPPTNSHHTRSPLTPSPPQVLQGEGQGQDGGGGEGGEGQAVREPRQPGGSRGAGEGRVTDGQLRRGGEQRGVN